MKFEVIDRNVDLEGHMSFMREAKDEIENFGPNPALVGQGIENKSGRAISLLQEAGIAELGPFLLSQKGWKLRLYRAIYNAVHRTWKAERYIRVTDDEDLPQLLAVNQLVGGPSGPMIQNALGSLDVDIILDEGPDTISMVHDAYEAVNILVKQGTAVPPAVLIELMPNLPYAQKRKLLQMLEEIGKADPYVMRAKEISLIAEEAKIEKTQSEAERNRADAMEKAAQTEQKREEAGLTHARTAKTEAETLETMIDVGRSSVQPDGNGNARPNNLPARRDEQPGGPYPYTPPERGGRVQ